MIGLILAVLISVLLFIASGSAPIGVSAFLVGIYLYLIYVDIKKSISFLDRCTGSASERRKAGVGIRLWSSLGKSLFVKLERTIHNLDHLRWQLGADELRKRKVPDTSWWLRQVPTDPSFDREHAILSGVLRYVVEEYRCTASAILIQDANGDIGFLSHKTPGGRFEQHLRVFLSSFFTSGDQSKLGLHDSATSASADADLSLFGYRFSIVAPFERVIPTGDRALLWLGFPPHRVPSDVELSATKELASRITLHLRSIDEVVALSRRVTDAENRDKEKDKYIAHMSHDIRSPLQNIKTILTFLKIDGSSSEIREMIESAEKNCEGLGEIVEDLLDFSKFRAGRLVPTFSLVSLNGIVEDVYESFKVSAKMRGLGFDVRSQLDRCTIEADPKQIRRVLTNLVGNALKYTRGGEVLVSVERRSGRKVAVVVRDTGPGMSKEQLGALFVPFTKFDNSQDGFGLGLTVSKILTEVNKGAISVESEEGRGSIFSIEFESVDNVVHMIHDERAFVRKVGDFDGHVLLVGEDADLLRSVAGPLLKEKIRVVTVSSISDAASLISFDAPAALIVDTNISDSEAKRLFEIAKRAGDCIRVGLVGETLGTSNRAKGGIWSVAERVFGRPVDGAQVVSWVLGNSLDGKAKEKVA